MLIAHKNCTTCGSHPLYEPSASTTFSAQPGSKLEVTFGSQGGGTTSTPEVQGANCTVVTDTVRMAGRGDDVYSEFLICDNYSSGLREQDPDGIFGIGLTPEGNWDETQGNATAFKPVFWNLVASGQIPGPEFSFSFISDRGSPRGGRAGVLTLGGTDRSLYIPSTLKTIPLNRYADLALL